MKQKLFITLILVPWILLPTVLHAQSPAQGVQRMQDVLDHVRDQMMPLCSKLLTMARAIGGFGATLYIGMRVWRHIAAAEPIDFFPLFRPFVLALCIGFYPVTLSIINGVLQPTVTVTNAIVKNGNEAVWNLLAEREEVIKHTKEYEIYFGADGFGDRQEWYKYTHPGQEEGWFTLGNDILFGLNKLFYGLRYFLNYLISIVLEVIFYAAALCIDTIRTFHLIILAVLGPFVFAAACFDGFQQSLTQWLARYVNIFLWLPVANLFGAILAQIQQNMLQIDLAQLQQSGTTSFNSTDIAYLIFLVIGIAGYFTVPGIANYIVHAHTVNPLLNKVNYLARSLIKRDDRNSSGGSDSGGGHYNPRNTTDGYWGDRGNSSYHQKKISG